MPRIIFFFILVSFTLPVIAQLEQPDDLVPLPEYPDLPELDDPPPLPPEVLEELELDPELEPQITIIRRGDDTIEEHRINGELHMIKVIPRVGLPYYLVRNRRGEIDSHPGDAGTNVSAPMWRILEF